MDRENELDAVPDDEVERLRAIPTFSTLDDATLRHLAAGADRLELVEGESLFEAGEMAECGYVLLSGRMELFDRRRDGLRRSTMEVVPGALIGEIALIAPTPRPASAMALEPCELLRVTRADFLQVLEQHPSAAVKLRRAIAKRLEQTMKALDGVRSELERAKPV